MLKITVIIPTINREDYVRKLLCDLNLQTYPVHEVIVSDQSDEFIPIEDTYSFKLNHFSNTGKGPCISRNDAAVKANGDILVFLDDDARIKENFIEEITLPIRNNKTYACSGVICNLEGVPIKKSHKDNFWFFKITALPKENYSEDCLYTPGGCFAINRDVFFNIGMFDLFFDPNGAGEDREIALRLKSKGYKIHFNSNAKLLHAQAPSGGRRERGSASLYLIKNVGYIIYKYYGNKELKNYRRYLVKKRVERILRFDLPRYNFKMIFEVLRITNKKKYL